ncbi:hypothetical protein EON67_00945, partial [archaeon]
MKLNTGPSFAFPPPDSVPYKPLCAADTASSQASAMNAASPLVLALATDVGAPYRGALTASVTLEGDDAPSVAAPLPFLKKMTGISAASFLG